MDSDSTIAHRFNGTVTKQLSVAAAKNTPAVLRGRDEPISIEAPGTRLQRQRRQAEGALRLSDAEKRSPHIRRADRDRVEQIAVQLP
jgi:hypothetical protein